MTCGIRIINTIAPYVCDSFAAFDLVLHPGESVIVRGNVGDDGLFVGPRRVDVFGIEEPGNAQFRVGNVEGIIEIVDVFVLLKLRPVDQIWPMRVDERVEAEATSP